VDDAHSGCLVGGSGPPAAYSVAVRTRLAAILLALAALALMPGAALARSHHAARAHGGSPSSAATRAYVKANYALVSAARANLAVAKTAIASLGSTVAGECPRVAAEAPQNHDAEQLSNEVVGALEVAAYQPDKESMVAFAHAVRGLHWSNHKLTRMVDAYTTKLEGFMTLAAPSICADVKAWVASGYSTLPASTVAFDKGFYAYDIEAEEVSLRLLRPYESATEASLLRRTKQLEAPLAEFEAEAVSDYTEILDSLKLPQ
jgi:hypothetical protein